MVEKPLRIQETLAAGAHGYLLKNAAKDKVLAGIRTVLAGRRFLYSEISLTLLERIVNTPAVPPPAPAHSPLSRREH